MALEYFVLEEDQFCPSQLPFFEIFFNKLYLRFNQRAEKTFENSNIFFPRSIVSSLRQNDN